MDNRIKDYYSDFRNRLFQNDINKSLESYRRESSIYVIHNIYYDIKSTNINNDHLVLIEFNRQVNKLFDFVIRLPKDELDIILKYLLDELKLLFEDLYKIKYDLFEENNFKKEFDSFISQFIDNYKSYIEERGREKDEFYLKNLINDLENDELINKEILISSTYLYISENLFENLENKYYNLKYTLLFNQIINNFEQRIFSFNNMNLNIQQLQFNGSLADVIELAKLLQMNGNVEGDFTEIVRKLSTFFNVSIQPSKINKYLQNIGNRVSDKSFISDLHRIYNNWKLDKEK